MDEFLKFVDTSAGFNPGNTRKKAVYVSFVDSGAVVSNGEGVQISQPSVTAWLTDQVRGDSGSAQDTSASAGDRIGLALMGVLCAKASAEAKATATTTATAEATATATAEAASVVAHD